MGDWLARQKYQSRHNEKYPNEFVAILAKVKYMISFYQISVWCLSDGTHADMEKVIQAFRSTSRTSHYSSKSKVFSSQKLSTLSLVTVNNDEQ